MRRSMLPVDVWGQRQAIKLRTRRSCELFCRPSRRCKNTCCSSRSSGFMKVRDPVRICVPPACRRLMCFAGIPPMKRSFVTSGIFRHLISFKQRRRQKVPGSCRSVRLMEQEESAPPAPQKVHQDELLKSDFGPSKGKLTGT